MASSLQGSGAVLLQQHQIANLLPAAGSCSIQALLWQHPVLCYHCSTLDHDQLRLFSIGAATGISNVKKPQVHVLS